MIYLIIKTGVYRHEIKGLFHYLETATKTAKGLIEKEPDDHHSFDVLACPVGMLIEDGQLIASVSRRDISKKGFEIHVQRYETQPNSPF